MKEQYCKTCKHPESNHHNGMCSGQMAGEYPNFVLCDCKKFEPKTREDFSQAAARIVKQAT